ncbi:ER membrane chaperone for multipass membrane protein, PAT complex subunit (asterix), Pat10 [Schizosaccharomyces osmophilus]|uniref:ER membrane chaperone for multipass membrane protein, PAT complex subunit (Asterix), Pat10 n=1 Tax=Schizosaccharomyces osmophilus TaxID=2545709 RepID=A0AAE9WEJ9_9SCHI|nr:ER membrane chaperone for multipass membrane protein, PAT complex subunit (asterix), Pat10 [Schizosaccharomyces osmophilus]WBW74199.1 ER membrane chaperone for multipass membrane protein, PAT complex subunit (asterix), Pat10 [Schizosaccharomyces osmophilus]
MAHVDPKRADLVVPYKAIPRSQDDVGITTVSTVVCMAALFLRIKFIAWAAFILAASNMLNSASSPNSSPMSMAFLGLASLISTYLPYFLNTPQSP